jgi:hypothetical protein
VPLSSISIKEPSASIFQISLVLLAPLVNNPLLLLIVGGVLLFNAPLLFGPR